MTSLLEREDLGTIVRLTLNRPKQYNPLCEGMLTELHDNFDRIAENENIRVVIVAARGKAFCAGHDLKEIHQAKSTHDAYRLFCKCSEMMLAMIRLPQPVIACVQGIATAAGCQLVAAADLAVASSAARFAVSGINLGLFCSTPSVALSRNISRKHALEMLFTGDFIGAEEAKQKGLVNRVAEPDKLDEATMELAKSIAKKSRDVLQLGKQLFYSQIESEIEDAYYAASDRMAA